MFSWLSHVSLTDLLRIFMIHRNITFIVKNNSSNNHIKRSENFEINNKAIKIQTPKYVHWSKLQEETSKMTFRSEGAFVRVSCCLQPTKISNENDIFKQRLFWGMWPQLLNRIFSVFQIFNHKSHVRLLLPVKLIWA